MPDEELEGQQSLFDVCETFTVWTAEQQEPVRDVVVWTNWMEIDDAEEGSERC